MPGVRSELEPGMCCKRWVLRRREDLSLLLWDFWCNRHRWPISPRWCDFSSLCLSVWLRTSQWWWGLQGNRSALACGFRAPQPWSDAIAATLNRERKETDELSRTISSPPRQRNMGRHFSRRAWLGDAAGVSRTFRRSRPDLDHLGALLRIIDCAARSPGHAASCSAIF